MTSANEDNIVTALYDYNANDPEELSLHKNEQLTLIDSTGVWYKVRNRSNKVGLVPSNYVKIEKNKGKLVNRIANKFPGAKKTPKNTAVTNARSEIPQGGYQKTVESNMSDFYLVKFSYEATRPDELSLQKGMIITVLAKEDDGWWQGKNQAGNTGWFPSNYVEPSMSQTVPPPAQSKGCIHVVQAIYTFNSNNAEELSFEAQERLDVIDMPSTDPEWYEARNAAGETGLVPRTYVEIIPNAPSVFYPETRSYDDVSREQTQPNGFQDKQPPVAGGDSHLAGKPWYVGPMTRIKAETTLNSRAKDGEFLIRNSESTAGDYSISMKAPDKIKHFKVSLKGNNYCIGQRQFESLEHLIEHYRKAPIYTTPSGSKMFLGQPLPR